MPAPGDVLLDSSAVIPYFKGDTTLQARFQSTRTLFIPHIVVGELYCGANLSENPLKHVAKIKTFLTAAVVLSSGLVTAECYGRIRADLARAGTPIPENDIWIAAVALEHQLP